MRVFSIVIVLLMCLVSLPLVGTGASPGSALAIDVDPLDIPVVHQSDWQGDPGSLWDSMMSDEALTKTIFYPDDRVRISPALPTVAFLVQVDRFNNPIGSCSGTFIGPDVLLTAAHCLYHPDFGGWPSGIVVAPGADAPSAPYGSYRGYDFIVPQGWLQTFDPMWDWGLVTLSQRIGDIVGWETIAALTTPSLQRGDFQPVTVGYPGDRVLGTQWATHAPSFLRVESEFLFSLLDAFSGQSGSGVFRGSDGVIVGIMSHGLPTSNVAVRLTADRIGALLSWCADLGCSFSYWIEQAPPAPPAGPAFNRTWARTDKPVAEFYANRTWMWGPKSITGEMLESYLEGPNGQRVIIYYDKTRMEVTDPYAPTNSPWYVTNGLLVSELVIGVMQTGDDQFEPRAPAMINVAGDPDDPTGPTYATFLSVLTAPPTPQNAPIIQRIDRAGNVGVDASLASYGVYAAFRVEVPGLNHQVASVFWDFMNSFGTVYENDTFGEARLFENPFYATGYPITEPYWAVVKIGGTYRLVLMQCFQRRCLTYTPDNPPGWQVEAGNVGLHYYRWRYGTDPVRP